MASGGGSSGGSPCGACKFLRRKCAADCIFAPHFSTEQGAARFAAIHKVFGASNVSKLLMAVPAAERCEAVVTIAYEAQARLRDPVYGCVAHIFALQQQVACLQAQLNQAKALLAHNLIDSSNVENQWPGSVAEPPLQGYNSTNMNYFSPQSSLGSMDPSLDGSMGTQEMQNLEDDQLYLQHYSRKRPSQAELGELQELALRMMRN
ncbi:hypothetical protein NMG60_11014105 [Bertholletia excelsa]